MSHVFVCVWDLNIFVALVSEANTRFDRNDQAEDLKHNERDRERDENGHVGVDVGDNGVVATSLIVYAFLGCRVVGFTGRLGRQIWVVIFVIASTALKDSIYNLIKILLI